MTQDENGGVFPSGNAAPDGTFLAPTFSTHAHGGARALQRG
jgi:hypothetical protein